MKKAAACALLLSIAACAAPRTQPTPPPDPGAGTTPPAREAEILRAIARLEDARTLGPAGELLEHAAHREPAVRERAATALGRLKSPVGGEPATLQLRRMLRDDEERVRAAAAFALGLREDASAAGQLLELGAGAQRDRSSRVRARALEAASKLGQPQSLDLWHAGLADPDAEVRLEAAAGAARWKPDAEGAARIDAALAELAARERDPRVRTYALFALERRKAAAGLPAFLAGARAAEADERIFAVRGLASLASAPDAAAALVVATRDADPRVAVEALRGLGKAAAAPAGADRAPAGNEQLEAVLAATASPSHHVRAAALEAAAARVREQQALLEGDRQRRDALTALLTDLSPLVRAAAVAHPSIGNAIVLAGSIARDPSPHVRAAAVRARARLEPRSRLALALPGGAAETDLLVRGAEIEALAVPGALPPQEAAAALVARLDDPDNGLRLAAVTALLELEAPAVDVADLARCFDGARGEIATEVRFNVLKLAAKVGGDAAQALLRRGLEDPDAFVRRTAHQELCKLTGTEIPWVDQPLPAVELAFAGEGALADPRPRVVIATARGELEFVLLGDEAPQHVQSFLRRREAYAGTTFHRIVSDFVAQGGDARGDGNGGASWRGDALRHEITPRKHVRGSLGMPRNDDWDSGGSQLYVTHRPTPHLDGRYTIFGELVRGFDVLDALDLGDAILAVRVVE